MRVLPVTNTVCTYHVLCMRCCRVCPRPLRSYAPPAGGPTQVAAETKEYIENALSGHSNARTRLHFGDAISLFLFRFDTCVDLYTYSLEQRTQSKERPTTTVTTKVTRTGCPKRSSHDRFIRPSLITLPIHPSTLPTPSYLCRI